MQHNDITAKFYLDRGNASKAEKDFDRAMVYYHKALVIEPKNAALYHARGTVHQMLGNLDAAISDYDHAHELDYWNAEFHNSLGTAYQAKGKLEIAKSQYREAIEKDKNYAIAYRNLGDVYLDQDNLYEAINNYNKALALNAEDFVAYNNRGKAFLLNGEINESIADLTRAIKLHPKYVEAHYNLGAAYFKKSRGHGDRILGFYYYDHAVELDPNNPVPYEKRAELHSSKKKYYDQGIEDYTHLIKMAPTSEAYYKRGMVYQKKWELGLAMLDFTRAISLDPEATTAKVNLYDLLRNESKERIFDVIKSLPHPDAMQLLKQAFDEKTLIGKKMWEKRGWFKCAKERGILKKIRSHHDVLCARDNKQPENIESAQVRRAARLIAQGTRNQAGETLRSSACFFSHIPHEIGVRIAAFTSKTLPLEKATQIALDHFGKPPVNPKR